MHLGPLSDNTLEILEMDIINKIIPLLDKQDEWQLDSYDLKHKFKDITIHFPHGSKESDRYYSIKINGYWLRFPITLNDKIGQLFDDIDAKNKIEQLKNILKEF